MEAVLQYLIPPALTVLLAVPLGGYISRAMSGEKVWLTRVLAPCEQGIYRLLGVKKGEEMGWKKYLKCVLALSAAGFLILYLILLFQGALPMNPRQAPGMDWDLALNTAVSFITNTNWQSYQGETQASLLVQTAGFTVQNFLSAGTGIAVLFAFIRGFMRAEAKSVGNFWVDLTRAVLYVLLPLSLSLALLLVSQGVPQSLKASVSTELLEPAAFDGEGNYLEDAVITYDDDTALVTVNGRERKDAEVVTEGEVPLGMAAGQIAIKQLGSNGGGYYGSNAAHPLENPTPLTNLAETVSILLVPAALCFAFGREIRNRKQGRAVFFAMAVLLAAAVVLVAAGEQSVRLAEGITAGNMEGKESRFGIPASALWAAFTTASSNGSVNAMHGSLTPVGVLVPMLLMQLGGVVFGGVGCGLQGMLIFALLAVFLAGLMVGRTPEFLGKKIEPREMKWIVAACLAVPVSILTGCGIAAALPGISGNLGSAGMRGFTELLYAFSSAAGNNGSAMGGFQGDTVFLNLSLAACMLAGRFVPMGAALAIAGGLAKKKKLAATAGTLRTDNGLFCFLLIFLVLLVGALSFFPALTLGPIALQAS